MTQRNEPSVGTSAFDFSLFAGRRPTPKTPEQLVAEALKGFTDAQTQLETAQAAIAVQQVEHEAEIEKRQALLATANESHSRLGRIAERFKELLA